MPAARVLDFGDLAGWAADDHVAALSAYHATVHLLGPDWPRPDGAEARSFLETHFVPVETGAPPGLITGYYEPEVEGSATCTPGFAHPLYAPPEDLPDDGPWLSRSEIEDGNLLSGNELVWLSDPVEVFFAQVQGSVRVRLGDGSIRRYGYAAKNGHEYRSVGKELTRRGIGEAAGITADGIRDWCRANPAAVQDLLRHNPSFVFFQHLDLAAETGPIGTAGCPVTPMRSIAVDPDVTPLGAPVWVEGGPLATLMIAQDTGSAIKGAQRGDVFCGTGADAGRRAGGMRISGRLVTLFPRELAERIAP
ncbi:MltA domain-containing protein [Defluviimonas sp. WL0050]|uniref:peptidoglycan lytic exotransglycosylase n=1 Tax=Albidovulum litorale TaxID=2984134 RepID=A0ABT2ZN69_9RHOB|nr:MltA domain-containing protein [Defluviimonas sp. WL0050]MCV2872584.1 MltA domain-containing protein [Defluviimonas sp. WL0050]